MINIDLKYYVCTPNGVGIDRFDLSDDQMMCISGTKEKSRWIKFDLESAKEASKQTGWSIVEVE